jgi:hypothetical protein
MFLFRDFLRLLAVVDFVVVESLPACRHTGFSATRGGIVITLHLTTPLNLLIFIPAITIPLSRLE